MSLTWRSALQRGIPIGVSAGTLVWLLGQVDRSALLAAVDTRVAAVMIPARLAYGAVTLWLEARSIRRLLPNPPSSFQTWTAARIKCASYLLGVLHYTLGVGALAVLLRRRTGLPLAEAASLVLVISWTDLLVVLTGASATAGASGIVPGGLHTGLLLLGIGGFLGGFALLRMPGSLGPFERVRQLGVFGGLRRLPLARLVELLALRICFAACFVAGCAAAFAAFQITAPLVLLVSGILVVGLVSALPIAVAGLGTSQAAFVYVFRDVAPAERLLAMSLVLSFAMISLRAGMGFVFARELTREALHETRAEVSEA